ncbi:MAG TPA: hypothetical protein ENH82_00305 [bacterium]|nr:hypothetical protein [bacterium]
MKKFEIPEIKIPEKWKLSGLLDDLESDKQVELAIILEDAYNNITENPTDDTRWNGIVLPLITRIFRESNRCIDLDVIYGIYNKLNDPTKINDYYSPIDYEAELICLITEEYCE